MTFSQEYLRELGKKLPHRELKKHLMLQELKMWKLQGEQVSKEEFDWICDRRGFSPKVRSTLKEALKKLNIGSELM